MIHQLILIKLPNIVLKIGVVVGKPKLVKNFDPRLLLLTCVLCLFQGQQFIPLENTEEKEKSRLIIDNL